MRLPFAHSRLARGARRGMGSPRRGFTLVELLIVMLIIAILASLTYGALFQAQATAREARTKALIAKLHGQMMGRWEGYRTRRVPLATTFGTPPRTAAYNRLQALRDLMRMELPDKIVDVNSGPLYGMPQPALQRAYQQKALAGWTPAWESAECLYLILTTSAGEEGLSAYELTNTEVGDFDNDGMKEFHDGWGRPICFCRWPAGFISDLQPVDPTTSAPDPLNNHDPFDPLKVDNRAFALFPLIFSAGPDGGLDVNQPNAMSSDPYSDLTNGRVMDTNGDGESSFDNIHNHNIGTR